MILLKKYRGEAKMNKQLARALVVVTILFGVIGCGGDGGNSSASSSSATQFALTPMQIPISATDKLVTVTIKQGSTSFALLDYFKNLAYQAFDNVIPSALAAQISPTLSTQATAKVVAGQVLLVNPVFSTTVKVPDPADATKTIDLKVSVTCDTASIPLSVNVKKAWALDLTTGDLLINMDYPSAVSATYDKTTNTFSACSFTYTNGLFTIFSNGSTSKPIDLTLGVTSTKPGCNFNPTFFSVIAAGDPSRNSSSVPLLNSLSDTASVGSTGLFSPGVLCGSVRAFDYKNSSVPVITEINFSNDVLPNNSSFAVDATHIYAVGSSREYGGYAVNSACPVAVTQIGAPGSSCIGIQNSSTYISYPVSATQVQAAGANASGLVQKPYPSLFLGSSGTPMLSLQTYSGLCGISSCDGSLATPAIFGFGPGTTTAQKLLTAALDSSGFPWGVTGSNPIPVGTSNDYLMFSLGGSNAGVLANISTGNILHTCTNLFGGSDIGCTYAVESGDFVYGLSVCGYQGASPDVCINSPQIGRVNTLTGTQNQWDLKSLGYLPLPAMSNSTNTISLPVPPIFYTDQVVFLACPSPHLTCPAPNWVSLNFSTGQITPVTTGGITFAMLSTLIGTTLWTN
jgi:hypothetical protein